MQQPTRTKNLFLRILPYFISFSGGVTMYLINNALVKDSGISTLIVNIASGLLSIPIIFIFYEIVNDFCVKGLRNSMQEHLVFEINYSIIDILKMLHDMLNIGGEPTEENLEVLLEKDKKFIREHLTTDSAHPQEQMQQIKAKLQGFLHNASNASILPDREVKALLSAVKSLGILAHELERDATHREIIYENVSELLKSIRIWHTLCEEDAILNHHAFNPGK